MPEKGGRSTGVYRSNPNGRYNSSSNQREPRYWERVRTRPVSVHAERIAGRQCPICPHRPRRKKYERSGTALPMESHRRSDSGRGFRSWLGAISAGCTLILGVPMRRELWVRASRRMGRKQTLANRSTNPLPTVGIASEVSNFRHRRRRGDRRHGRRGRRGSAYPLIVAGLGMVGCYAVLSPDEAHRATNANRAQSAYYPSCAAARAAGVAPIAEGEPGYREELDADGDGVACEPYRGR